MLIISLLAFIAFGAVFARGVIFALKPGARRQADNAEVGFMLTGSFCYVIAYICLWVFEPWKLMSNSPWSTMFMGFTIFNAAYFYRRIEAMTIGRERRRRERRTEDHEGRRRDRRPDQ
ncbi:hypothetical protein [Pseudomonas sp. SLFW]|uniref:hypothetical protein n=1 Tax=Pseudomonas sp. SLFW TaxID=2683259 RepID=UPI0014124157|nr:hypothetical protein [Pseudomonas sp. SLFW]NBB11806.1 hypothetical protein [Pseudomonas sp. SLFW]